MATSRFSDPISGAVTLRPSLLYWVAKWVLPLAGAGALMWLCLVSKPGWLKGAFLTDGLLIVGLVILALAFWDLLALGMCTKWVITKEDIVIYKGVLRRRRNYTALYRVIDYDIKRSPLDLLMGTGTLTIHSTDRTDPHLKIYGIRNTQKVQSIIHERVEYQRETKGIKEFTNVGYYNN